MCRLTDLVGQISNAYRTFPPGIPRMRIFAIEPSSGTSTASVCVDSTSELVGQNSGLLVISTKNFLTISNNQSLNFKHLLPQYLFLIIHMKHHII